MSDKYYYEEGAIHHDHHKVINVGEIKDCDLEKLMKTFFKDGDGVSEEISQPRQNTKPYKPFTAKDADVFSALTLKVRGMESVHTSRNMRYSVKAGSHQCRRMSGAGH